MPILEPDFSNYFSFNFNQFDHYLDAVLNKIDPFPDDQKIDLGITGIDDSLFVPTGMYVEEGTVLVIFDSGCSVAVSPCKDDFGDTLQPFTKTMIGLGDSAIVEG